MQCEPTPATQKNSSPAVMSNPKFLYSGFYSFGPQDVMEFFEEAGVPLKIEKRKPRLPTVRPFLRHYPCTGTRTEESRSQDSSSYSCTRNRKESETEVSQNSKSLE